MWKISMNVEYRGRNSKEYFKCKIERAVSADSYQEALKEFKVSLPENVVMVGGIEIEQVI